MADGEGIPQPFYFKVLDWLAAQFDAKQNQTLRFKMANPMCAVNSIVAVDAAGNRKLHKGKAQGRIDEIVALAMALPLAFRHEKEYFLPLGFEGLLD